MLRVTQALRQGDNRKTQIRQSVYNLAGGYTRSHLRVIALPVCGSTSRTHAHGFRIVTARMQNRRALCLQAGPDFGKTGSGVKTPACGRPLWLNERRVAECRKDGRQGTLRFLAKTLTA